MEILTPMEQVKATAAWVAKTASHVAVDSEGIEEVVENMGKEIPKIEWDFEGIHYFDDGPLTVQYLLVLDTLNFCFWPDEHLSYDDLASGLKAALENDKSVFDADRLQKFTGLELRNLLKWPRPLPLEDERIRLLHEVGFELERSFGGKASNLVESCDKSAVNLVATIASHFPGFRDHSVYKGHQIFLYKRAQIFVADLYGAFKGKGYGEFKDINSVTIFADYIVPAVLQQLGILKYSSGLVSTINSKREIASGSEEEVELRACSIYAVEKMRDLICVKSGKQVFLFSGAECGAGPLAMGFWCAIPFSPTPSDALNILLSTQSLLVTFVLGIREGILLVKVGSNITGQVGQLIDGPFFFSF